MIVNHHRCSSSSSSPVNNTSTYFIFYLRLYLHSFIGNIIPLLLASFLLRFRFRQFGAGSLRFEEPMFRHVSLELFFIAEHRLTPVTLQRLCSSNLRRGSPRFGRRRGLGLPSIGRRFVCLVDVLMNQTS